MGKALFVHMTKRTKMSPIGIAKQTLSWSFSASYLPVMAVVCSLTPKVKRTSRGPAWVRGWGEQCRGLLA